METGWWSSQRAKIEKQATTEKVSEEEYTESFGYTPKSVVAESWDRDISSFLKNSTLILPVVAPVWTDCHQQ